ncbi:hypothetical protein TPELB_21360 [Terrisporobacter petrolearius]|uniref:Lipoprotein n=1 Tax=Terrisporobacter petrolearius TaxID=1460447 RepID=A0ABZ3FDC4_9FIRM
MNKLIAIILCLSLLLCVGCSSESESDKIINDYLEDKKHTEEEARANESSTEEQEVKTNGGNIEEQKTFEETVEDSLPCVGSESSTIGVELNGDGTVLHLDINYTGERSNFPYSETTDKESHDKCAEDLESYIEYIDDLIFESTDMKEITNSADIQKVKKIVATYYYDSDVFETVDRDV